jgi:predicted kinase
MREKEHFFYLHYDSLKWLFSQYSSEKRYEEVKKIVLTVAETVFKMGYNVVSDSSLIRASREKLIDLATKNNYEILEINLEADYEILLKRFNERVAEALLVPEKNRRIANLSVDRFKELFNIFNKEKNSEALTFRTDNQSIEEVSEQIMKLL